MTRLVPLSIVALLLLAPLPRSADAQARQSTYPADTPEEHAFVHRLSAQLTSPDAETRTAALLEIIQYGTYGDGTVKWRPVVAPLVDVYQKDPDVGQRRLAVASLHAIQHPLGMETLRRTVRSQPSPLVQRAAVAALVDYYGLEAFEGDVPMARFAASLLTSAPTPVPTVADAP